MKPKVIDQKSMGLGAKELRQRQDDLKSAMELHASIRKKLAEAVPLLTQAADMALELERDHLRKPVHRAAGLGIRLGARHIRAAIISIRTGLVGLVDGSERLAARNADGLIEAVEDPHLLDGR